MGFTSEYSLDKMNEKYCEKKFLILFVSGWVRCGLGWGKPLFHVGNLTDWF